MSLAARLKTAILINPDFEGFNVTKFQWELDLSSNQTSVER